MSDERGFTLAEILVASAIVGVGLTAVAAGLTGAARAIAGARAETVAVFLAEDRLEELRAAALVNWSDPALDSGASTELVLGGYTRSTTVTDAEGSLGCAPACKRLRVRVAAPADGTGSHTATVDLVTVVARRH